MQHLKPVIHSIFTHTCTCTYTCTYTIIHVHVHVYMRTQQGTVLSSALVLFRFLPFQFRKKARGAAELASSKIRICNHRVSRLCGRASTQPRIPSAGNSTHPKVPLLANKTPEKANQLRVWQKSSARDIKLAQATPPAMFSLITLE